MFGNSSMGRLGSAELMVDPFTSTFYPSAISNYQKRTPRRRLEPENDGLPKGISSSRPPQFSVFFIMLVVSHFFRKKLLLPLRTGVLQCCFMLRSVGNTYFCLYISVYMYPCNLCTSLFFLLVFDVSVLE